MCTKANKSNYPRITSFIEDYPNPVYNSLLGSALINKDLVILDNHNIVMRRDYKSMKGKVKIIGGGGAGIEPAEVNYIGKGMLTAAVVGDMYAAPSANEILMAIRELAFDSTEGILLLVKNYVGDKLNFGIAMDRASSEGIFIKMLVLGDDGIEPVSLKHGRRGLAGCTLIYKIAGQMAEEEKGLEDIIKECRDSILTDMASVSLMMPASGKTFSESLGPFVEPDEMVLGMGVYGQPGMKKMKFCPVERAVSTVMSEFNSFFNSFPDPSTEVNVVALVNNHGFMTKFEESVVVLEVVNELRKRGINPVLLYAGIFMSGLNNRGFSVTLLKVNDERTLKYLEAPTSAPAWPKPSFFDNGKGSPTSTLPSIVSPSCSHKNLNDARYKDIPPGPEISQKASAALRQTAIFAAEALISCEKQLNIIDSEVGDGDTGTNMRKVAEALKQALLNNQTQFSFPSKFLHDLSDMCCNSMGGVSGALYTVFFSSAAEVIQDAVEITPDVCCAAFRSAVRAIKNYGKSELGDRTVLDVLCPAVDSFESAVDNGKDVIEALYLAAASCEFKSEGTKTMKPPWMESMGIGYRLLYADAGAHAATIWLRAVTFEGDSPTAPPGIFLWKFLTANDCDELLAGDVEPTHFMTFIEQKIGGNETLLAILLNETYKFSRENYGTDKRRISALVGTVYYTHIYFTSSLWRNPSEVYYYFRESMLCQAVEFPPKSAEVFSPEEVKEALVYFVETYVRNLPLVRILHLPHYELRLKLKEKPDDDNQKMNTDGTMKTLGGGRF